MEALKEAVLLRVQYNVKQELMKQLNQRHYYTGHGVVIKSINDIKSSMNTFVAIEMDEAERRLSLLSTSNRRY